MAHTRRGLSLATFACLLALSAAGCTPADPPAPPPTTSSPTPTENAQEREQRLAYEAAEKSYREFRAEYYRVLGDGGSERATKVMKATAAGPYLSEATELAEAFKGLGQRSSGTLDISEVHGDGYAPSELVLSACEDSSRISYLNSKGKKTGEGEIRIVKLTVRKLGDQWKIWSGTGKKVSSCVS